MFNRNKLARQKQEIDVLRQNNQKLQVEIEEKIKTIASLKNKLDKTTEENTRLKEQLEKSIPKNRMVDGIVLTDEQNNIVDMLENTSKNYFITGKAGTGKSTVLNCFRKTTKKEGVAAVAPTGAAALNIDGQTIHSLFRMDFEPQDTWIKSKVRINPIILETLKAINVLIIDEVSMVRADIMDMIDARMKLAKGNNLPFGGCQVIVFGDLYQLPPIARDRVEREFIESRYGTLFFFGAPEVKNSFSIVELKEVVRQKDQKFIHLLNEIREGRITESDIREVNTRYITTNLPEESIRVMLTNSAAAIINKQKLAQISSEEYVYATEIGGDYPPLKEDVPFDYDLRLKVGARIMMTKNDPARRYVNGSIGTVTELSSDSIQVSVGNETYNVERQLWTKKVYKYDKETKELKSEIVGWARQYPIKLAWAITIHKSQGQTYDKVIIDYGNTQVFAAGQTYVALSRSKTLDGIYLTRPLTMDDIYVNVQVNNYMKGITPKGQSKPEEKVNVLEIPEIDLHTPAFTAMTNDEFW